MQRFVISLVAVMLVLSVTGFTAGIFTGESRKEESCAFCRAVRYTGVRYGFSYERIDNNGMCDWYHANVDKLHGLDSAHPHVWQQSACSEAAKTRPDVLSYDCGQTAPLFLLRPEIERSVLEQFHDHTSQLAMIEALNTKDRRLSAERVHRLIEYFYIDREKMSWPEWWTKHASEFGMPISAL